MRRVLVFAALCRCGRTGYVDRSNVRPGMIEPGDVVVRSFAAIGWSWGAEWTSPKDIQHFSATGD